MDITDRMDNSFYSGAVNIGYLNLGLVVGNTMQIVGCDVLDYKTSNVSSTICDGLIQPTHQCAMCGDILELERSTR